MTSKGGRPKGTPKTGGRRKGTPNKATAEIREIAQALVNDPPYRRRLTSRFRSGRIAPAIEALLWHYAYGKPKETIQSSVDVALRTDFVGVSDEELKRQTLELMAKI